MKKLKRDLVLFILAISLMLLASIFRIDNPIIWAIIFGMGAFSKAQEGVVLTIEDKALNVEFLMIFAAIGAVLIGYYHEGIILILIFSLSGILEEFAMVKAESTLSALLNLSPQTALLKEGNDVKEVEVNSLKVDDIIVVHAGQQISADGVVVKGEAAIDQASMTGESIPVTKEINQEVFAGTICLDGSIEVKVSKSSDEFLINKMSKFIQLAKKNPTRRQSAIENFEKYYVLVVVFGFLIMISIVPMLGIFSFQEALYKAIVLLVVASPCALVASSAPAMLSAMSWGSRHGLLIKGSKVLESLSMSNVFVFDKTGTLTVGKPRVHQFEIKEGIGKSTLVNLIYAMEKQSNHPLAKVIQEYLEPMVNQFYDVTIQEIKGQGIVCIIGDDTYRVGRFMANDSPFTRLFEQDVKQFSSVSVFKNDELIAYFLCQDTLKEDAQSTLSQLKEMNIQRIVLTGDTLKSSQAIISNDDVDEINASLMPNDKLAYVQSLKNQGSVVTMVGDGINDTPSLALADVGIAMYQASDLAMETADIVLMNNKLDLLIDLKKLSKKATKIVTQNIVFSMGVLIILVFFNLFGHVQLPLGVVFHEGSTILVILNGLRLLKK